MILRGCDGGLAANLVAQLVDLEQFLGLSKRLHDHVHILEITHPLEGGDARDVDVYGAGIAVRVRRSERGPCGGAGKKARRIHNKQGM